MKIKRIIVGPLETNCYLIIKDNKCLIVDPGDEYHKIINEMGNLKLLGVLVTHRHFDHIGALDDFIINHNIITYDKSAGSGKHKVDIFDFEIIINSGHSSDSISFYFEKNKILFCGDFIFKGTIGRTDLPTGNDNDMNNSLQMVRNLPVNTKLYPGHGEESTLEHELKNNPFLRYL